MQIDLTKDEIDLIDLFLDHMYEVRDDRPEFKTLAAKIEKARKEIRDEHSQRK